MGRAQRILSWDSDNFIQTWSLSNFWLCFPKHWPYSHKLSQTEVGKIDTNSLKLTSNLHKHSHWDRTSLSQQQFWNWICLSWYESCDLNQSWPGAFDWGVPDPILKQRVERSVPPNHKDWEWGAGKSLRKPECY